MEQMEIIPVEPVKKKRSRIRRWLQRIPPLTQGWKGACLLLSFVALCISFVQGYYMLGSRGIFDYSVGTLLFLAAILAITGIVTLLLHLAKKMPSRYLWAALFSFCLLFISFITTAPLLLLTLLSIMAAVSALGAILYRWFNGAYKGKTRAKKIITGLGAALTFAFLCLTGYWLLSDGEAKLVKPYTLQAVKSAERYQNTMPNPAEPGSFKVKTWTYGSENSYRKEFNAEGSLVTKQVDGSAFVDNWSALRTKTFGFGPEAMPLNGSVWFPEGEGPFPLVVTVHGNHLATDYSDTGYGYLGTLLASRGYIFVSVDENFLNTSPFDDLLLVKVLEGENRARGWLLLEHLKTWKDWNAQKSSPLYGKVDMNRIALIGHSRGGEAAAVASAYNKLPAYPDDGNIKFNYNFNIRSVISIAGTDGQYQPAGQPVTMQDINFLALQGAHDMDVSSFDGANQYSRVTFTEDTDLFKTSVYLYGANHGQFNTKWGDTDSIGLGSKWFNTAQLISQDEQLLAAKVLISAFLDSTLKGESGYRAVFQDLGYAREWLPNTMYISNYWDAGTKVISTFDEDIDLGTTTLAGGRLDGVGLKEWTEEKVKMKFSAAPFSAVRLGWDRSESSSLPAYKVILPDQGLEANAQSSVVFAMANGKENKGSSSQDGLADLTVKVTDSQGNTASLPLSSEAGLLPMFEGNIVKRPFSSSVPVKEPVFQNYSFKLADLQKTNPKFNPKQLAEISFVFDRTDRGTVWIRDIGIRIRETSL
ncbi:alpha/beta hydrolase family protein [Paenibacillus sp. CN-4]|uniref:alpha/beta hydrolase family protein n=1 Tax=Paenibacillus nanchangensis TaxID=3348343 RepID=UPI00397A5860